MINNDVLWQNKIAAWVHDPAEKSLVLFRDPAGHEGGTVATLRKILFPHGISEEINSRIKKADQWASAADRPQFPLDASGGRYQSWAQVRFTEKPQLIHPLSGDRLDIHGGFEDLEPAHLKAISIDHFEELVVRKSEEQINWVATTLAFWRFVPKLPSRELSSLWSLLPADTRVPDHTIWSHLDLTSAFSGAMASDESGMPALLAVSFGPVQDFIAQARSTSDLWAGSHLLSRLAWEGLKVICENLGPDAVIFPQLRGVPLVDVWLQEEMGLDSKWFDSLEWRQHKTDTNPLFAAALPNRFVALVPADKARTLAKAVSDRVREWIRNQGSETVSKLLEVVPGLSNKDQCPAYEQSKKQLADFPEVYWAAVPWSLIKSDSKGRVVATEELAKAMRPFFSKDKEAGFLGSQAWEILSKDIELQGAAFFKPNPGVLYPAVVDLLDRMAAAAKTTRAFGQLPQEGYRCTLCGEREWLTTDRDQLFLSSGERKKKGTLWTEVEKKPAWSRKGEHLCALCSIKRLWPGRFVEWVRRTVDLDINRFVVSTHTMALTPSLKTWLKEQKPLPEWLRGQLVNIDNQTTLPKGLAEQLPKSGEDARLLCRKLPIWLDEVRDKSEESSHEEQFAYLEKRLKEDVFGHKPEAYYGLIMMDGDRMGAWLNASEAKYQLRFIDSWHTQVRDGSKELVSSNKALSDYLYSYRPSSPARHTAISEALNSFAMKLASHVVEDLCTGKLLYAGGDDVLAMVSVDELLPALLLLRMVYSGILPGDSLDEMKSFLGEKRLNMDIGRGYVRHKKQLYRMMGGNATASAGAVVAHHTAPLSMVLRVLRQTEKRAKNIGGRDAFALTLLKRAGGAVELTCPWLFEPKQDQKAESVKVSPMGLLIRMRNAFASPDLSRRSAYQFQDWACKLPDMSLLKDSSYGEMLAVTLSHQFKKQSRGDAAKQRHAALGLELADLATSILSRTGRKKPVDFIIDFIATAEFLARESRIGNKADKGENP